MVSGKAKFSVTSGDTAPQAPVDLDAYLRTPIEDILADVSFPPTTTLLVSNNQTIASVLEQFHLKGSRCTVVQKAYHCSFTRCVWVQPRTDYALFDVRDLSYHVMRAYQLYPSKTVDEILAQIKKEKVWNVANVSGRVPFIPHQVVEPLSAIVASFAKSCRVPIFKQQHLIRVLSPADLLHIFSKADLIPQLEARGNLCQLARREAFTIRQSESLLKALSLMERHGYSAIPIVSEQCSSHVLEVITVKDIKYLLTAQAQLKGKDILNAPALSYVHVLRGSQNSVNNTSRVADWAMIHDTASVQEIFSIFTKSQVHRLIFQDAQGAMTGLLTLSDVMTTLADVLAASSGGFGYNAAKKKLTSTISTDTGVKENGQSQTTD